MTDTSNPISMEDLSHHVNALLNYSKTGYKQALSIIDTLKHASLTAAQVLEIEPGPWLHYLEKMDPTDDDEKDFQEKLSNLMKELNSKFKQYKGASRSHMSKVSKEKAELRATVTNENDKNTANASKPEQTESIKDATNEQKSENKIDDTEKPQVPDAVRDFTVKNITQGLLTDYKNDPQGKKEVQPVASEKAAEIEDVIRKETDNPEEYRLEARNVSNFLMTKNNEGLREGLLQGEIPTEEFVKNKEEFLNDNAKAVIQENEKRHFQDINADFDRHMVPESQLYKCESCGSSRIVKTEKQMNAAERGSTSVLVCAECEAVVLK